MLAYRMREHGVYFENSGLECFIFCACTARMHGNRRQSRVWPRMLIVAHVGVGQASNGCAEMVCQIDAN